MPSKLLLITGSAVPLATAAPMPTTAVEVHYGQGIEALQALQHDWSAIAATLPHAGFHHRHAWYLSYLQNIEQCAEAVHFYSFFRNGRPIAIFPLRRTKKRAVAGITLWLWELPVTPHMNLCDCMIAHGENGAELIGLLIHTLKSRKDLPWDALHLPNLLEDSLALGALRAGAFPHTVLTRMGQSMYFRCGDYESAMCNNTGKFRRNLRRQRKKLDQRGRIEVSLVRDRAVLDQAFAAFLQVEASGWKGTSGRGSAIMLHPHLVRFYRDLMTEFAASGNCLISLLKLDGVAIAAQFCIIADTTVYVLKIAYDEAFSAAAPGSQLLHDVLRYCCDAPSITHLSLVTGPAWAVGRWNPEAHDVWQAIVFNSSPRGLAAYAAKRLKAATSTAN